MNPHHIGKRATATGIEVRGLDRRRYSPAQSLRGIVDVVEYTLIREAAKNWMANNVKKIWVEAIINFGKENEVCLFGIITQLVAAWMAVKHQPFWNR